MLSADADDFTYWLYLQNRWNRMNLDVTDLDASIGGDPEVILDGINYNSDGEYNLAPKPLNNNGRSIQDKIGHFTGKITLKKANNRYIVKRFTDSSANKFSEVKFYSPDPCSDNPNHYKLTSYWSNQTKILTDIDYDCLGSEPVLAVVNKYRKPNYSPYFQAVSYTHLTLPTICSV